MFIFANLTSLYHICYLLGELAEEIEHYWGAILDRSFSEGAANNTTPAVAAHVGAPDGPLGVMIKILQTLTKLQQEWISIF